MVLAMDKCMARVRVRDAHRDDLTATILKEKENTCLLHMEMFPSQNSNLYLCTNPVGMHVLGRVMLDLLRSRSLLDPLFTTRLSIKQCSSLGLNSSPFPSSSLMLRESKKRKVRENEGFYRWVLRV